MKSLYSQFMILWYGWIVERKVLWGYVWSNWTIWIMLSFMSNVLILDVLTEYDLWSLKGKVWELCMTMRLMNMLYEHF